MNTTFAELGLNEQILAGVATLGYETPTPVQVQSIPYILEGRDVVAIAQTGTGKTAAFALPSLQRMSDRRISKSHKGPFILVVSPTRELAQQAERTVNAMRKDTHQRALVVTGGAKFPPQIKAVKSGCNMLIATPGRLLDLLSRKVLSLQDVEILILDEADRMLDMGFWPDIQKIMAQLPEEHQTLLFSATMPDTIKKTMDTILKDPAHVSVAKSGDTSDNVEQYLCPVAYKQKTELLIDLLKDEKPRRALVFCRTKRRVDEVARELRSNRFRVAPMHSDCSQRAREIALKKFRKAHLEVLVATDVLARGIDVDDIDLVVNYDCPMDPEDYVHRIGRTGRAGKEGRAFTFVAPDEISDLLSIEYFTKEVIPTFDLKDFEYDQARTIPDPERSCEKPRPKSSKRRRRPSRRPRYRKRPGAGAHSHSDRPAKAGSSREHRGGKGGKPQGYKSNRPGRSQRRERD